MTEARPLAPCIHTNRQEQSNQHRQADIIQCNNDTRPPWHAQIRISNPEQHLVNVFQRSASLFLPPLQNSCVFPPAISVAVSAARPVALLQFAGPAEVGTRSLGGPLSYDMYPPPHMTCISGRSWYAILGRASEPF
jgi:hypothetical protein